VFTVHHCHWSFPMRPKKNLKLCALYGNICFNCTQFHISRLSIIYCLGHVCYVVCLDFNQSDRIKPHAIATLIFCQQANAWKSHGGMCLEFGNFPMCGQSSQVSVSTDKFRGEFEAWCPLLLGQESLFRLALIHPPKKNLNITYKH
jgi:hypothetical protein